MIIALLGTNSMLIYQNLKLQTNLQKYTPREIEVGKRLNVMNTTDTLGAPRQIKFDGESRRVLFYFHTKCGFCSRQMPYWKKLVALADKDEYRFTAITTESDSEAIRNYLNKFQVEAWEVLGITEEVARSADFTATPTTIVVNNDGVIVKVWVGMWKENDLAEAEKYFHIDFHE